MAVERKERPHLTGYVGLDGGKRFRVLRRDPSRRDRDVTGHRKRSQVRRGPTDLWTTENGKSTGKT